MERTWKKFFKHAIDKMEGGRINYIKFDGKYFLVDGTVGIIVDEKEMMLNENLLKEVPELKKFIPDETNEGYSMATIDSYILLTYDRPNDLKAVIKTGDITCYCMKSFLSYFGFGVTLMVKSESEPIQIWRAGKFIGVVLPYRLKR